MNIPLKPFQEDYVLELHGKAARALENWRRYDEKQIISFTAPTGAGKTIMMASFIETMLCGDNEGSVTAKVDEILRQNGVESVCDPRREFPWGKTGAAQRVLLEHAETVPYKSNDPNG